MPTYGIDASSANKKDKTGVEWHAYHVIQHLKELALGEGERVVLFSPTPLEGDLATVPPGWESRVVAWPIKRGWMQGAMTWELVRRPVDVLYVPAQGLPRKGGKRATVTTVHDIGFRRQPQLYPSNLRRTLESVTRRAVRRATILFSPSDFTKAELADAYRVAPERIVLSPNAVDPAAFARTPETINATLRKHRLSTHYFLFVGRLETKKNVATLIRAFETFRASRGVGDPFELVLVGKPGFGGAEIQKYYEGSSQKNAIRLLGYLPEDEVADLMRACTAYMFPSWYEGFGIPNLEAMICQVPLITSDIPAHREVAGNAALFVPPGEAETWAKAMRRIVEEPGLKETLVARGTENVQRYSWSKTAQIVLETLRSLVK